VRKVSVGAGEVHGLMCQRLRCHACDARFSVLHPGVIAQYPDFVRQDFNVTITRRGAVGQCRLTLRVSKPELKSCLVSALKLKCPVYSLQLHLPMFSLKLHRAQCSPSSCTVPKCTPSIYTCPVYSLQLHPS
jgi:hypothetical protein